MSKQKIINFKDAIFLRPQLISEFQLIDKLFQPSLLNRIQSNNQKFTFSDYIDKVNKFGDLYIFYENDIIKGVITIYSNNTTDKIAYISLLFVKLEYQGHGIARELLNHAIQLVKDKNFKFIQLKTWTENNSALNLYIKNNFSILKEEDNQVLLQKKL